MLMDEFKLLENQLIEKVLYFALSPNYCNHVDRAKESFEKILMEGNNSYNEKNFISWLLWDYKLEDGNNFFKEYVEVNHSILTKEKCKIIEALSNTYLSIYEIIPDDQGAKLIDIFSKKEFAISEQPTDLNGILIGRIANYNNKNYILDEYLTLDKRFQSGIERSFYEKLQEYRQKNKFCQIEEFVKNSSILLYGFANIVEDISKKQVENNLEYSVFQSNYVVLDFKGLYDILTKNRDIELDYEEKGVHYFIMYEGEKKRILSEIVLFKDKLEIEATSKKDRINAQKVMEANAKDLIKHIGDEVLTMDDIL